jgi:hypothetical protein
MIRRKRRGVAIGPGHEGRTVAAGRLRRRGQIPRDDTRTVATKIRHGVPGIRRRPGRHEAGATDAGPSRNGCSDSAPGDGAGNG